MLSLCQPDDRGSNTELIPLLILLALIAAVLLKARTTEHLMVDTFRT